MSIEPTHDIIIVGGGISGLTAGIYAARAGQKTLIIEGGYNSNTDMPGGQLLLTNDIENFPGYSGSGDGLIEAVREQAESSGCEIETANATGFDFESEIHTVMTDEDEKYSSHSVILATGAVARRLGIPGEDTFFGGKGVSTCATCDGFFFKDKNVAVVGGGDTAVEDALYLADIVKKVYLVHRRDELRTDSPESRRLLSLPNVEVLWNSAVSEVKGTASVESAVIVSTTAENEAYELVIDGLFVAIGHDPATKAFAGTPVELVDGEYLSVKDTFTNIPGVFGAGDVADSVYRQAITAAATGAQAAMNAIKHNKSVN